MKQESEQCMNHWWNISEHLEHPPYTEVLTHTLANEHNWNLPISDRHRNMWERCCVHPSSTDWILWEWSFTSLVNGCFLPNGGYLWQDYRKWQLTSQTNPGCWSNMALPSFGCGLKIKVGQIPNFLVSSNQKKQFRYVSTCFDRIMEQHDPKTECVDLGPAFKSASIGWNQKTGTIE